MTLYIQKLKYNSVTFFAVYTMDVLNIVQRIN